MSEAKKTEANVKAVELMPNSDRLSKWREERLQVAEAEKAERIRAKEIERSDNDEKARLKRLQVARALVPTEQEIAARQSQLAVSNQHSRNASIGQFILMVVAPLMLAAYYLTQVATPLHSSETVVLITSAVDATDSQQTGLLNSLSAPANLQDAFVADAFIGSPALLNALEAEMDSLTRWSSDLIDPVFRLRDLNLLNVSAPAQAERFISSHVDIQTGLLTLEVRDPDSALADETAEAILASAAAHLDELNAQSRAQQMGAAETAVFKAQEDLLNAQQNLLAIQVESGEVDPRLTVASVYETIRNLEAEAIALAHEVQKIEIAGRGDSFLAEQTRQLEELTRDAITLQKQALVEGVDGRASLNSILVMHDQAMAQVQIAQDALANAFAGLEAATLAAAQNQSIFQVVVPPQSSSVPTFPRTVPTLLMIFLIAMSAFVFMRLLRSGGPVNA